MSEMISQLITIAMLAAAPVSELRGSIPLAILQFDWSWELALGWSLIFNLLAIPAIFWLLPIMTDFLRKVHPWLKQVIDKFYTKKKELHRPKIDKWGSLALFFVVAIPLPGTGAWTGSLLGWLFGIEKRYAYASIALGVLVAGILVSVITLGSRQVIFDLWLN